MLKMVSLIPSLLFYGLGHAQGNNRDDTSTVIVCECSISYPKQAEEKNITGTVIIAFDIDSNFRIMNIRVEKSLGYGCDEEAINALKKCKPRFNGTRKKCTPIFNLKQPFTFIKPSDD